MALPKLSDLSPAVQAVVVIVAGVVVAGGAEYVFLQPVKDANTAKSAQVDGFTVARHMRAEINLAHPHEATSADAVDEPGKGAAVSVVLPVAASSTRREEAVYENAT